MSNVDAFLDMSVTELQVRIKEIDSKIADFGDYDSAEEVIHYSFHENEDDNDNEDTYHIQWKLAEEHQDLKVALGKKRRKELSSYPGGLPLDDYEKFNGCMSSSLKVKDIRLDKRVFATGPKEITPGVNYPEIIYYELLACVPQFDSENVMLEWRKTNTEENLIVFLPQESMVAIIREI